MNKPYLTAVIACCLLTSSAVIMTKADNTHYSASAAQDEQFDFDALTDLIKEPMVPKKSSRAKKMLSKLTGKMLMLQKYVTKKFSR